MPQPVNNPTRSHASLAAAFAAGVLAVVVLQPRASTIDPAALAQPGVTTRDNVREPAGEEADVSGRISAAEQRKVMIAELRGLSARLDRIENLMKRGLEVRVTEMPGAPTAEEPRAETRPEPRIRR